MSTIQPAAVHTCERCGAPLPTVELPGGNLVAVQPMAVITLAPGRFKVEPINAGTMSPEQLLAKMMEHSMIAVQTLPGFIPHDFVCAPDGKKAPLDVDLRDMQTDSATENAKEGEATLDFLSGALDHPGGKP